ncbi:MAG: NADPH-dependent F420 reductase [Candidatus Bathyarchaeia archaeon]
MLLDRRIALVGGTGNQGPPLAVRWALSGNEVWIGSRSAEKAWKVAVEINEILKGLGSNSKVGYGLNREVVKMAEIVVLTIPFEGLGPTIEDIRGSLEAGTIIVSPIVPCKFDGEPQLIRLEKGSAAEIVAEMLPGMRVIAALHTVSSKRLEEYSAPVEGDVIVCGDDTSAKKIVMNLVEQIPNLRALDGGGLENAHIVEEITVLLIKIGRMIKKRDLGIKIE